MSSTVVGYGVDLPSHVSPRRLSDPVLLHIFVGHDPGMLEAAAGGAGTEPPALRITRSAASDRSRNRERRTSLMAIEAQDLEDREFLRSEWTAVWCLRERRLILTFEWIDHHTLADLRRVMAMEDVPDRWGVHADPFGRPDAELRAAIVEWYNILDPDTVDIIVAE